MDFNVAPFSYQKNASSLRKIKIQMTKEKLTASAGLGTIVILRIVKQGFQEVMVSFPTHLSESSHEIS